MKMQAKCCPTQLYGSLNRATDGLDLVRSSLEPLVSPPVQGALPGGEHQQGVEQCGDQGEGEHGGQQTQQPSDRAAVSEHAGVP